MVKNKVLILGGCGFIGKNLSKYLLEKDYDVTATYFKRKVIVDKKIDYIKIDLKKIAQIKNKLRKKKFTYVINCAGYINHSSSVKKKDNVFTDYVKITHSVIDYFKNKKIIKYVNFGTSDEYGNSLSPQNENQKNKPQTLYALSKTYSHLFLKKLWEKNNFPFVTLRLFLVYGPGQSEDRLIPYIIKESAKDNIYKIYGGNQVKDFCFIEDLCEAVALALDNDKVNGHIINIASGKKIEIKKIVKIIYTCMKKGRPSFQKKVYRKSENTKLWADIKKAKRFLKWKPKTNITDGLKKTVNSYLQSTTI